MALAFGIELHIFDLDSDETETVKVNESFFTKIPEIFKGKKILTAGVFELDTVKRVRASRFDYSGAAINLINVKYNSGSSRTAVGGICKFAVLFENLDLESLLKEEKLQGKKYSEYLEILIAKALKEKSLDDSEFETLQLFMVGLHSMLLRIMLRHAFLIFSLRRTITIKRTGL